MRFENSKVLRVCSACKQTHCTQCLKEWAEDNDVCPCFLPTDGRCGNCTSKAVECERCTEWNCAHCSTECLSCCRKFCLACVEGDNDNEKCLRCTKREKGQDSDEDSEMDRQEILKDNERVLDAMCK